MEPPPFLRKTKNVDIYTRVIIQFTSHASENCLNDGFKEENTRDIVGKPLWPLMVSTIDTIAKHCLILYRYMYIEFVGVLSLWFIIVPTAGVIWRLLQIQRG